MKDSMFIIRQNNPVVFIFYHTAIDIMDILAYILLLALYPNDSQLPSG